MGKACADLVAENKFSDCLIKFLNYLTTMTNDIYNLDESGFDYNVSMANH